MQTPFLIGEKIYLRPVDMEDIDNFVEWLNDPEVRQYLSLVSPFNKTREKDFIDDLYKDERKTVLGIVMKEDDRLIGNIGLSKVSLSNRNCCLGIVIGDKSCWSQGCGTEALKLMLGYAFDQLNLHRVYLTVLDFNSRAIRAYEKAGFKKEGTYRKHMYKNGKYCDLYYMGILKDEWRKMNHENPDL
ncbi:GNAT family N-acetyltransferase [Candidatus Poribacteria bacterium]|nr:GNAT family N-acetyltransferase [Candidatus Poribacteria bacterium]